MSIRIQGVNKVITNLNNIDKKTNQRMVETMKATMAEAEASAKRNAPWTDRTGNARNSITGDVTKVTDSSVEGILKIGVNYGKYLELRWNGRYRIIQPTIDWAATRVPIWAKKLLK